MKWAYYKKAYFAAAKAAGVETRPYAGDAELKAIAEYLPLSVLRAVVKKNIIEDNSVILNNARAGEPSVFYPHWVSICEEEIIERLLTDKS